MHLRFISVGRLWLVFLWVLLVMPAPVRADHVPYDSVNPPQLLVVVATRFSKSLYEFTTVFSDVLHDKIGSHVRFMQMHGESGMVGADYVSQATDDGSVFLLSTHSTQSVNSLLQTTASYSPESDLVNIGMIGTFPAALIVPANSPFHTFEQLLEAIHQKPADYRMGYYNTTSQVAAGLFAHYTNLDLQVMPYKSRELFVHELLADGIQFAFLDGVFVADLLEEKKVRVLASTGVSPVLDMDNVALTTRLHPDFILEGWVGVAAPSNVPAEMAKKMSTAMRVALGDPIVNQAMKKTGIKPVKSVCLDMKTFIQHDTARWRERIRLARITPR